MVEFIKGATKRDEFPDGCHDVVFVGRSNVGKSSLLNAIYNQKIAFVGKKPGMTKMINFFDVDHKYLAVDVPGYGFANRNKSEIIAFGRMMDDYFSQKNRIRLVVMIVDSRHRPSRDDLDMIEYLRHHHLKICVVANKIDKLNQSELHASGKVLSEVLNIDNRYIFKTSTLTKRGIDELKNYIVTCVCDDSLV